MIIQAGFTPEMIEQLKSLKGKIFKSYECDRAESGAFPFGFRINLGRSAFDVTLDYHPLDGEPAGYDEPTWFSCSSAGLDDDFEKYLQSVSRQYLVDETILCVEIVEDRVVNKDCEFTMLMDMALVIRTKYHTYTFSRGEWFSNIIAVEVSDVGSGPVGLDSVEKLWIDENETVQRSTITL